MTTPAAAEWHISQPGKPVLCRGTLWKRDRRQGPRRGDDPRDRDERRGPRPCHEVIIRVGLQEPAKRARLVGRVGKWQHSGLRGDTHACPECGFITEMQPVPAVAPPLQATG